MRSSKTFQDVSLLLLRLIVGAIFLYAGAAKWTFWTTPVEGVTGGMLILTKFLSIVEPIGGVAVIAGFLTRWAATGLAVIMVGAAFFVRFLMGAGIFTSAQGTGVDYVLLILAGCIVLMAFGAGKWAVDGGR